MQSFFISEDKLLIRENDEAWYLDSWTVLEQETETHIAPNVVVWRRLGICRDRG